MLSPVIIFIGTVICAVILVSALPLSLFYYKKAQELGPLNRKKEDLEAEITNLEEKYKELEKGYDNLRTELANAKDTIANKENAQKWLEDNGEKLKNLQEQIEQIRQEYTQTQQNLETAKNQLSTAQEDLQKTNSDRLKNEEINKDLSQKNNTLQNNIQNFEKTLERLTSEIKAKSDEKNALTNEVSNLNERKASLTEENAELFAQNESLKANNHNLASFISKQEDALNRLNDDLIHAKAQINEAKTIEQRNKIRQKAEQEIWHDLDDCPIHLLQRDTRFSNEIDTLTKFSEALSAGGFVFDERTIYEFHTSLLCTDVSPLSILSGISGTGKSLLPELYADFFGINFLSVAVQPRWDGPQDLFGFYNHMESRFSATELTKYLWNFDEYNNSGNSQDQMCLVLLDEMNLAKVEYYFSELLSKLENRNRVSDPKNEADRRSSEIELDCGAGNGISRRVFVWKNILFVGTMNEDESTQTLSSKVIDRANVIRFGVPQNLNANINIQAFKARCLGKTLFSNWGEWQNKNRGLQPQYQILIQQLKDALNSVGRGFGFRTENAIQTYILRYPTDNWKNALADQIEMKILPKLNGLECEKVQNIRNSVEKVLNEIQATDIRQTFDRIIDNPDSTYFAWEGIR